VKLPDRNLKLENWGNDQQMIRRLLGDGTYWVEAAKNVNTLSVSELEELVSDTVDHLPFPFHSTGALVA
jgi:hypothetical protein